MSQEEKYSFNKNMYNKQILSVTFTLTSDNPFFCFKYIFNVQQSDFVPRLVQICIKCLNGFSDQRSSISLQFFSDLDLFKKKKVCKCSGQLPFPYEGKQTLLNILICCFATWLAGVGMHYDMLNKFYNSQQILLKSMLFETLRKQERMH